MSTTIIRHCDHCKRELGKQDVGQIWIVQLLVTNEDGYQRNGHQVNQYLKTVAGREEWCRPCVDKMNLLNYKWEPKTVDAGVAPTFEDQLREIIQDEISAARE
jgi:hypothetical protein